MKLSPLLIQRSSNAQSRSKDYVENKITIICDKIFDGKLGIEEQICLDKEITTNNNEDLREKHISTIKDHKKKLEE